MLIAINIWHEYVSADSFRIDTLRIQSVIVNHKDDGWE